MKIRTVCSVAALGALFLCGVGSAHAQRPGTNDDGVRPFRSGTNDDSVRPFRRLLERATFDRRAAVTQVLSGVQVRVSPRVGLDQVSADELAAGVVLAEYEVSGSGKATEPAQNWKATLPDGRHLLLVRRERGNLVATFLLDGRTPVAAANGKVHEARGDDARVRVNLTSASGRGTRARRQKVVTRTCFRVLGVTVFCVERVRTISNGSDEEDEEW